MVDRIGKGGGLAREALLAAMKAQAEKSDDIRRASRSIASDAGVDDVSQAAFDKKLGSVLESIDEKITGIDQIPEDMLSGKVDDFHEVAVQIKKAEFSFRFAMEIRNKLLDAYREVMRMNV